MWFKKFDLIQYDMISVDLISEHTCTTYDMHKGKLLVHMHSYLKVGGIQCKQCETLTTNVSSNKKNAISLQHVTNLACMKERYFCLNNSAKGRSNIMVINIAQNKVKNPSVVLICSS